MEFPISMAASSPLDQDPFDTRQKIINGKLLPFRPALQTSERKRMRRRDRRPTSTSMVVLTAPTFVLDVQDTNSKEIMQETQHQLPSFYTNLLDKTILL